MQTLGNFKLPPFFNYPPYFTLQPVRDTREKQVQLWKELILDFCKTQKIFVIGFAGSLTHEAREAFLAAIVSEGRAEWLDKGHRKCLILWHCIQDWADIILNFVKDNGLEDSVTTVEEIRTGPESRGDRSSRRGSRHPHASFETTRTQGEAGDSRALLRTTTALNSRVNDR